MEALDPAMRMEWQHEGVEGLDPARRTKGRLAQGGGGDSKALQLAM